MEINAESHNQTSGGAWRVLWRRERKDERSQRGQGHHENTKSTDKNSRELAYIREPVGI